MAGRRARGLLDVEMDDGGTLDLSHSLNAMAAGNEGAEDIEDEEEEEEEEEETDGSGDEEEERDEEDVQRNKENHPTENVSGTARVNYPLAFKYLEETYTSTQTLFEMKPDFDLLGCKWALQPTQQGLFFYRYLTRACKYEPVGLCNWVAKTTRVKDIQEVHVTYLWTEMKKVIARYVLQKKDYVWDAFQDPNGVLHHKLQTAPDEVFCNTLGAYVAFYYTTFMTNRQISGGVQSSPLLPVSGGGVFHPSAQTGAPRNVLHPVGSVFLSSSQMPGPGLAPVQQTPAVSQVRSADTGRGPSNRQSHEGPSRRQPSVLLNTSMAAPRRHPVQSVGQQQQQQSQKRKKVIATRLPVADDRTPERRHKKARKGSGGSSGKGKRSADTATAAVDLEPESAGMTPLQRMWSRLVTLNVKKVTEDILSLPMSCMNRPPVDTADGRRSREICMRGPEVWGLLSDNFTLWEQAKIKDVKMKKGVGGKQARSLEVAESSASGSEVGKGKKCEAGKGKKGGRLGKRNTKDVSQERLALMALNPLMYVSEKNEIVSESAYMPYKPLLGMAGLDDTLVIPVLTEVKCGVLSLDEMNNKFTLLKIHQRTATAFVEGVGADSWEAAKEEFPVHTQEAMLSQYYGLYERNVKETPIAMQVYIAKALN
ncbi:hypothetical protein CBR_g3765 [Chara braunii]|uniref:Uncharacterized protein n=1 Tax=Chara braunii TaxID=69332 RepID=A0A388KGD4_CHABU|nr:hypothetical protein CBR_g3765 [Chara braunii]|eukprot:GBG69067.1 hypothetical protein CBR_g3765 [Chara braunii]